MQQFTRIDYTPELDRSIKNAASLPAGLNCKYLLCLYVAEDKLIAKSWHRKYPKRKSGECVVVFN